MTVTLPSLAILGAGSLGSSILDGLLLSGAEVVGGIRVTNRQAGQRVRAAGVEAFATSLDVEANHKAVAGAQLVLIGVKPAMVGDLLSDIGEALEPGAVIVSVAAGITIETIESSLPAGTAVVRAMPNTPTAVGRGVTALVRGSSVTDAQLQQAESLFAAIGEALVVPESQIDAVTAVSGSGPAYVYLLIESFTAAAVELGFSEEQAARLVEGTFGGAVELLRASEKSPAELRRGVTSPNGTTERAIAVLSEGGLQPLFHAALEAAVARAAEMAAGR